MGRPRARTFLEQSASRSRNQHDPTNKKEQLRQTVNRRLAERDIRCACRSTHSDDCGERNKTNQHGRQWYQQHCGITQPLPAENLEKEHQ